jgi:hypothetical protein
MRIRIQQEEAGGLLVATVSGRVHYREFLPVWQKSAEAIGRLGKIRVLIVRSTISKGGNRVRDGEIRAFTKNTTASSNASQLWG